MDNSKYITTAAVASALTAPIVYILTSNLYRSKASGTIKASSNSDSIALKEELKQAKKQLYEIESKNQELKQKINEFGEEREFLTINNEDLQKEVVSFTLEEKKALEDEILQLKKGAQNHTNNSTSSIEKELKGSKDKVISLEAELEASQNAKTQTEITMVKLREKHEATISELREELSNVKEEAAQVKQVKEDAQKIETELKKKIEELEAKNADLNKQVQQAKKENNELNSEKTSAQTVSDNATNKISELNSTIEDFKSENNKLKGEIKLLEKDSLKITEYKTQIEDLETEIKNLKEDNKNLKELSSDNSMLSEQVASLQAENKQLFEQHSNLVDENDKYRNRLAETATEYATYRRDSTKEIEQLKAKVSDK